VRVSRLVRMHADERQEIEEATAGAIAAAIGLDCASGDTLCSEGVNLSLEGMFVPDPVITLAITPENPRRHHQSLQSLASLCPGGSHPARQYRSRVRKNTHFRDGGTAFGDLHRTDAARSTMPRSTWVQPAVAYRETIARQSARLTTN
jgi:elongation factor G